MKKLMMALAFVLAPVGVLADVSVQPLAIQVQAQDQYYDYNFGTSYVHSRRFQDFTLTANGPDSTFIRGMSIRGMSYQADTNCPQILMPGQTCLIRVFFHPYQEGGHWGDLTIFLRDSNIFIRLYGHAIR